MKELITLYILEQLEDLIQLLGQLIDDLEWENLRLRQELRKHQLKKVRLVFPGQQSELLM